MQDSHIPLLIKLIPQVFVGSCPDLLGEQRGGCTNKLLDLLVSILLLYVGSDLVLLSYLRVRVLQAARAA